MHHGGHRPGAGRPKGSPNKATQKRQAEIAASGLTPLDFMLEVLRDPGSAMEDRKWAAERAAPYVHPRLSAIQAKVEEEEKHYVIYAPEPRETSEEWFERYAPKHIVEARKNSERNKSAS
jgi:hypothetical protein